MAKKKTTKKDANEAEGKHPAPGSVPAQAKKEKKAKKGKAAKATKTVAKKALPPVDPRETVGNKGGSLSNRLRAVLR